MTPEERLYQEAIEALNKRELPKARDLFTRLLKLNRQKADYWIGMSAAVETTQERGVCLKEALKFDPQNHLAISGLRLIGENVKDSTPDWKFSQVKTNWKTSLEMKLESRVRPKPPIKKMVGLGFLGLLIVAVITGGFLLAKQKQYRPDTSAIVRVTLTITPTASSTPTITTSDGIQLLDTHLSATFTPTPLYAATPHNRSEAYSSALNAYAKQDWGRAVELLKQVIAEEPGAADLQYLLGEIYRLQKNYKEANIAYDAALKANATFAPAYLGKGRVSLQTNPGKPDDALAFLNKAIQYDPNLYEALLELANVNLAKGDTTLALSWLEKYLEVAPPSAIVEYTCARAYLLQGDLPSALTAVVKAREMDISYIPVYRLWGEILQADGRYQESLLPLLTFLKADPTSLGGELLLANAYFHTGDMDKALSSVNLMISSDNKVIDAYLLRGDIYMTQGKLDLADTSYLIALQLNYRSFGGFIGRARVQLVKTNAGAAYNYLDRAIEAASTPREEAIALYWQAAALVGLDEMESAIRHYEEFLALPAGVAPLDLRNQALTEYMAMVTPTPTATQTTTSTPLSVATFTPTK